MSEWKDAPDAPGVQYKFLGGYAGYRARYAKPIPPTRVRCEKCFKDIVPKKDGSLHGHKCELPTSDRRPDMREIRGAYATPGEAIGRAIAADPSRPARMQGKLFDV